MARFKITFVCQSVDPGDGGIARVARNLLRVLEEFCQQKDLSLRAFCLSGKGVVDGKKIAETFSGNKFRFSVRVFQAVLDSDLCIYDTCYLARLHPPSFVRKIPNIIFIHGIEVWEQAKPAWIRACRSATILLSNSDYTRKRADKIHGGFSRAQVCWLGTEPESDFCSEVSAVKGTEIARLPVVLMVGRMSRQESYKGHSEVLGAWPQIRSKVPNAILKIIGRGDLVESLKLQAQNLGVADSVLFLGFVDDIALMQEYMEASALVLPSRGEGFGLVYIEAMRCGLPVIASTSDAAREVIGNQDSGLLVDLADQNCLVEGITSLLKDRERRVTLGEKAKRRWQAYFTFQRFSSRVRPVIARLCDQVHQWEKIT